MCFAKNAGARVVVSDRDDSRLRFVEDSIPGVETAKVDGDAFDVVFDVTGNRHSMSGAVERRLVGDGQRQLVVRRSRGREDDANFRALAQSQPPLMIAGQEPSLPEFQVLMSRTRGQDWAGSAAQVGRIAVERQDEVRFMLEYLSHSWWGALEANRTANSGFLTRLRIRGV